MKRKNWTLGSFIVGVLGLFVAIVAIFANGIMTEEARELTGLKPKETVPPPPPATLAVVLTTSAVPATATVPPAQVPVAAGSEFTIVEESPQVSERQPTKVIQRPSRSRRHALDSRNGTRYELAKLSDKVDDSVRLVFEDNH